MSSNVKVKNVTDYEVDLNKFVDELSSVHGHSPTQGAIRCGGRAVFCQIAKAACFYYFSSIFNACLKTNWVSRQRWINDFETEGASIRGFGRLVPSEFHEKPICHGCFHLF